MKRSLLRCSILHTQYVKMTARNQGNTPNLIQTVGSGFQSGPNVISRATRIVKFYFSTLDSGPIVYNVGSMNDCLIKMHYKDAWSPVPIECPGTLCGVVIISASTDNLVNIQLF